MDARITLRRRYSFRSLTLLTLVSICDFQKHIGVARLVKRAPARKVLATQMFTDLPPRFGAKVRRRIIIYADPVPKVLDRFLR